MTMVSNIRRKLNDINVINVMYNKYRDGDYLGEIGETSPIDGETVTCATKWKGIVCAECKECHRLLKIASGSFPRRTPGLPKPLPMVCH